MKWIANSKDPAKILDAIKQGLVMGRPQAEGPVTRDMLEAAGWFGFYDPDAVEIKPMTVSGSVTVSILDGTKEPTSDIDDRIKELKKDKNNPKKYRARWTGTKYVYEPIK